jgi:serine/threonine protein kinase
MLISPSGREYAIRWPSGEIAMLCRCSNTASSPRSTLNRASGVMLYLMAVGRLPFTGRDPFEVMRAHMADPPPRLAGQIDQRYADLCEHLLQKAAEDRPQSAAVVAQELEQILGASPSMNVLSFPTRRASL